jgi:hypothetical protein
MSVQQFDRPVGPVGTAHSASGQQTVYVPPAGRSSGSLVYDLPFEEYITLDGEHATGLKDVLVSPLLYHRKRQLPRVDRDAMRVGRATHTSILEPDRFALDHAVWRAKDGRRGTKVHKAFAEANTGRTLLTEAQYNTALAVRNSVRNHAVASKLLASCKPEVTVQWSIGDVKCKSRFDLLGSCLVDIKTTRNPAPGRFSSDAARLAYALQMGFYYDAALAATGEALPVKIIAAQNVEPFDVVVYDLPDDVINLGRDQYRAALETLLECRRTNTWPGIAPSEEITLHLPAWATPEAEEEQLTMNGVALFGEE